MSSLDALSHNMVVLILDILAYRNGLICGTARGVRCSASLNRTGTETKRKAEDIRRFLSVLRELAFSDTCGVLSETGRFQIVKTYRIKIRPLILKDDSPVSIVES